MIDRIRPIVAAVHPNLINELKFRQSELEQETGRKIRGGLTIFSELAAEELRYMRVSGEVLKKALQKLQVKTFKIDINGESVTVVSYEDYKKLFRVATALSKKKDQQQIKLEIQKIKGLKKNEVRFLW